MCAWRFYIICTYNKFIFQKINTRKIKVSENNIKILTYRNASILAIYCCGVYCIFKSNHRRSANANFADSKNAFQTIAI